MKFAKEIERDLVPEWRIKYLDYKAGKKHIKAITKAIARANGTPSQKFLKNAGTPNSEAPPIATRSPLRGSTAPMGRSPPSAIPIRGRGERQSLINDGAESEVQYGSIVPTPPEHHMSPLAQKASLLELPGPAMKVPSNTTESQGATPHTNRPQSSNSLSRQALQRSASMAGAHHDNHNDEHPRTPEELNLPSDGTFPNSTPSELRSPRARLRRMFTLNGPSLDRYRSRSEYDLRVLDEVREKERDFYEFLDSELAKVEGFYKQKEDTAAKRLVLLREQLHEMRNRRTSEIAEARDRKRAAGAAIGHHAKEAADQGNGAHIPLLDPLRAKLFKPGPNSKALQKMITPVHDGNGERRDYTRRPADDEVPYRTAKRKLKLALQEFYRGLELLKSYALLNRTAFRKLNKKYDKALHARPPYRYMNEKVNKAWFVTSDVLDGQLQAVEDLYARYFERGNHKIAAGKLRSLSKKKRDESGVAFQSGILIGVGAVFAIQGLVYGAELLFDDDPDVRTQTSYLMQIYGGYFLMLYLFSLFCLNCKIWTVNRINYQFIFELDPRSQLDWRQLAEFPAFFLFLLGLFMWLNFTRYGSPAMYIYYPVLLIFVSIVILFFPAPILFHKSRKWFLYSHWRLFFAGLYPVEFRDFFLGDMYCSLTYSMSDLELFFCLYATAWSHPQNCNSQHSRLLGFFATLPQIWRFFQCLRRYNDTRNIFPHLVNGGKYTAGILSGVFLSVYRIQKSHENLALFIVFATINGFYTGFWDIIMDFSLFQPHTRQRYLRDITALKYRWPYYLIMVLDPILRFNWIFYIIYTHDTQHSSIASFLIGFSEVTRRGMWTLLRVENEHCANVKQYKASRDVPLPYDLGIQEDPLASGRVSSESTVLNENGKQVQQPLEDDALARSPSAARVSWTGVVDRTQSGGRSTGVDAATASGATPQTSGGPSAAAAAAASAAEEGRTPGEDSFRMRRRIRTDTVTGARSIRGILATAHMQDFEKKRKPEDAGRRGSQVDGTPGGDEEEDDDEDDDDEDLGGELEEPSDEEAGAMLDERMELREAQMLARAGKDRDSD